MKESLSVNRLAWKLLEDLCGNSGFYGVKVERTKSGTTIVDAGISAEGGFQAGKLVAEICMGGCAKAEITSRKYGEFELPCVFVYTDHPVIATLGSQYAGWQIKDAAYFAIGSGPGRALALKPKEIYEQINYKDDFDKAIIVLETEKYPPDKLLERFVRDCHVLPENLAVILTPTVSLAGAIQVSARIIETGIHKLRRLGLNPNVILHSWGVSPIPPAHPRFAEAMARTNDAIFYAGIAHYTIDYDDETKLKEILQKAPSKASKDYGKPFKEILKEASYDFYKVDPNLFAPAVLIVNNLKTGKVFKTGEINIEALMKSFGF